MREDDWEVTLDRLAPGKRGYAPSTRQALHEAVDRGDAILAGWRVTARSTLEIRDDDDEQVAICGNWLVLPDDFGGPMVRALPGRSVSEGVTDD